MKKILLLFIILLVSNTIYPQSEKVTVLYDDFIEVHSDLFDKYEDKYPSVPIKMVKAQAILESGIGTSYSYRINYNPFGLSYKNRVMSFDNYNHAFDIYYRNIFKHYKHCLSIEDTNELVNCVSKKYAEDPIYNFKVLNIMNKI